MNGLNKILINYPIRYEYVIDLRNSIVDQSLLHKHITNQHGSKDSLFILGMYGEFAVSAFMHLMFGYPKDIIPNKHLYYTDLKYSELDDRLYDVHVKTIDLDKKHEIISGMCNIKPGDKLLTGEDIDNDVIVLCGYSMITNIVKIYSSIPATQALHLWTNPKSNKLIGKTKALYHYDIISQPNSIDLSEMCKVGLKLESKYRGSLDDFFSF